MEVVSNIVIGSSARPAHEPEAEPRRDRDSKSAPITMPTPSITSSEINRSLSIREYLVTLWEQGMTNTRTANAKRLMKKAVDVTKMHPRQIKNFINNKRKKEFRSTQKKIRGKGSKRLYDIFMSKKLNQSSGDGNLPNEIKLKNAHAAWQAKKHDPETLEQLRRELKEEELQVPMVPSIKAAKLFLRKEAKIIEKKCKLLEKCGYECIFMAVHRSEEDYAEAGTDKGLEIANGKCLMSTFSSAIVENGPTSLDSLGDDSLRSRLQSFFNDKYLRCIGVRRTQYDRISGGKVKVSGMPPDIPFRNPAAYGRATKIRILKEAVHLKFAVSKDEETSGVQEAGIQQVDPSLSNGVEEQLQRPETMPKNPSIQSSDDEAEVTIHHAEAPLESAEDILLNMTKGGDALMQEENTCANPVKSHGKRQKKGRRRQKKDKSTVSTEKVYYVEEILQAKKASGGPLFLVKWEGYSRKNSTWEPKENLPQNMIDEFMSA